MIQNRNFIFGFKPFWITVWNFSWIVVDNS